MGFEDGRKWEELSSTGTVPETMEMTKAIVPLQLWAADLWMDPATRAGPSFLEITFTFDMTYLSDSCLEHLFFSVLFHPALHNHTFCSPD